MKKRKVVWGISPFEGVFSQWYGWAGVPKPFEGTGEQDSGGVSYDPYREGPIRMFKWRARIDALKRAAKLRLGK